jgi:membrane-bound lytic murein transglycosylase D
MKKTLTLIVCILSLQFVKASPDLISPAKFLAPITAHTNKTFFKNSLYGYRDTVILPAVNKPAPLTGEYNIYALRLDSIKKDVPLDYNEYVQSYIDIYAHNRDEMGRMLGLAKYYFPIYEKAFKDAGIPDELKYLSIVESKLNPYAVSRVGATGLWQFMYTTAKLYGLSMDDYVDDRRDPVQATYAAAAYLKDAYEEFGDWLLAIASYNCGKSNVEHAIDKAGASDFWSIRQYLPLETRNYVPAYIAVTYLMNYYQKHGIVPQACDMVLKTDTLVVNKYIALSSVAQALDMDVKQLTMLNPEYKRLIVNGTNQAPRRLVIPEIDKGKYAALYDVLNNSNSPVITPVPVRIAYHENRVVHRGLHHVLRRGESYITYKVKRGDTLSGIASRFDGVSVEKIKSLNGLKRDGLQPGMKIKISRG